MFFCCLFVSSECRVWSCRVAAVLPSSLPSMPQPQLCGAPGRRGRRPDPGRGGPAELWTETPGAVPVLDIFLCLRPVRALCCILEHFRLQPARRANTPGTMSCSYEADKTPYCSLLGLAGCATSALAVWVSSVGDSRRSPTCFTQALYLPPALHFRVRWVFTKHRQQIRSLGLYTAAKLTSSARFCSIQRCLLLKTSLAESISALCLLCRV